MTIDVAADRPPMKTRRSSRHALAVTEAAGAAVKQVGIDLTAPSNRALPLRSAGRTRLIRTR